MTSHTYWQGRATEWVARLDREPDPFRSSVMSQALIDAGALAQAGHDVLAGTVLRAWNAAVMRAADAAVTS